MRFLAASLMVATAMLLTLGNNQAGEKPKYSIKEVMKEAHKGKLMNKVAEGKADDTEKKHLVELYKSLAQNDPPKGSMDDWKKRTKALVEASEKAAKGDAAT